MLLNIATVIFRSSLSSFFKAFVSIILTLCQRLIPSYPSIIWGRVNQVLLFSIFAVTPRVVTIPDIPLKLKSRKISFAYNIFFNCPIISKLNTEHGSDTAVLCVKFWNDWVTEMDVMDEHDFMRFEFTMRFGGIYNIAKVPWHFLALYWYLVILAYCATKLYYDELKNNIFIIFKSNTAWLDSYQISVLLKHWGS